jgi:hypothetical protein
MVLESFGNANGATINIHHGDLRGKALYAVAVRGRGLAIPGRQISAARIESYIRSNLDLLSRTDQSLGLWYDAEVDVTWLDVSETFEEWLDAEHRGLERGERAIYALEEGREIRLTGDDDG